MNASDLEISQHDWPKVSVITPSFNQGAYIRETIESVLSQRYPNIEYIIIDGSSTDETLSVIEEYRDRLAYFVSEQDRGQSHALNKGFERATGSILCWLNSDDQFAPDAIWAAALGLETSQADLVAGICEIFEDGALVHRHLTSCADGPLPLYEILDLDNGWNAGQFFYQPEVFFTRKLWEKAGAHVREDCYYSMDYELWCRFALAGGSIHVLGSPLVSFRTHPEQKTADPDKFKAELIKVRDEFCRRNDIPWTGTRRPRLNWTRKLRVAFVNNLGFLYGAGIAHMRIAGAFEMAGHEVSLFDLLATGENGSTDKLLRDVNAYNPDFVIFGNLHADNSIPVNVVQELQQLYPSFWLTHDFWLITGRCGYMGNCNKYTSGCDSSCPTSNEYPVLAPDRIEMAWDAKTQLMVSAKQLTVLANSQWSSLVFSEHLQRLNSVVDVHSVRLGVPTDIFLPKDKNICKKELGIPVDHFVIAFSVSSLSDARKGGTILFDALSALELNNTTLLLIGRLDQDLPLSGINILSLGYVGDVNVLVKSLNAADIYVGPSLQETFGQVYIEAALCGTPSVGFDSTGVKNAIVDGITGLKAKEVSARALAEAIYRLYSDHEMLARLRITSAVYARNEHSLESSYHSFFRVLDDKGLIDQWRAPHKIAFSKNSNIIVAASRGLPDMAWWERYNRVVKKFASWLIGALPHNFNAGVAKAMPNWLKRRIILWLVG